jgi:DNA-binding transcriptional regulator YiaG
VREKAGLSPEEMAALIGMSDYGYRSWEAGHRSPGGPAHRLLALIGADPKTIVARLSAL